jgi:CHAD domain-containing protein
MFGIPPNAEMHCGMQLCEPVGKPKRVKRTIKRYKHIQSLLGDHQDTVIATEALRKMAIAAGTTVGENGFTSGLLYARDQQIARHCRQKAKDLRRSSKPEIKPVLIIEAGDQT